MAKEKKEPTETVRLRESMAHRVNRIAAHQKKSVPDYLAEKLADLIDADEAQMLEDLKRERGETGDKKKK